MTTLGLLAFGWVGVVNLSGAVEVEFVDSAGQSYQPDEDGDLLVQTSEGHVRLVWVEVDEEEVGGDRVFTLEQSRERGFPEDATYVRYEGRDRASVLTGFAEGEYWFRVRAEGGPWSEPLRLEVEYMERWILFSLVLAGLLVMAMTVTALLRGHFRYRDNGVGGGGAPEREGDG